MDSLSRTKIQNRHLEKRAAVYVRQSTLHQVQRHTASTRLQYDLCDRAVALGWPRAACTVYDADLGVSGSKPSERQGFAQLLADVALGLLGIILAFDVTRLARNSTDWHRLLDLCSLCGTLVADLDGIYDLSLYNDRLLLGLKGTMSEAEHHLIRTRLVAGMEKKAREGALRKRLPVGLDYDSDGHVTLHPDESVRHAIALVFQKFRELGTAHQVYRYFQAEALRLPVRSPTWHDVRWEKPNYELIHRILANPRYAGAYVYGRTKGGHSVSESGSVRATRARVSRSDWKVVLKDHHPGYVSWSDYEENLQRLEKNVLMSRTHEAAEIRRNGRGLLQGLMRCGVCGRRMYTQYPAAGDGIRYVCQKKARSTDGEGVCQSFGGTRVEDAVVAAFFRALGPAAMPITLKALERIDAQGDAVLQQLRDQLVEAQYRAERARRQFELVEPENRNVARSLERTWNDRLARVAEAESKVEARQRVRPAPFSQEERQRVLALGVNLRAIWGAATTEPRDRKRALQLALEAVFARLDRTTRVVHVTLVWEGGSTCELHVQVPGIGFHTKVTDEAIVSDVRTMAAAGMTDKQMANTLLRRGTRTCTGLPFSVVRVRIVRRNYGIVLATRAGGMTGAPTVTATQAAKHLGVSVPTVLRWLEEKVLPGEQPAPSAPWAIRLPKALTLHPVRQAPAGWLPLRDAANELGTDAGVLLQAVLRGEREAALVGEGRPRRVWVNVGGTSERSVGPLFDRS